MNDVIFQKKLEFYLLTDVLHQMNEAKPRDVNE